MRWLTLDLILFTGAVYGLAWLVTKSRLLRRLRGAVARVPFLGELVCCIVCTSAWMALGLALSLPWIPLFSPGFRAATPGDMVVLVAWSLATTWAAGRALGDAA